MSLGEYIQVGLGVLRTVVSDTRAILAQIGDAASSTVEADNVAWWQHVGFISRPSKAAAGQKSCEVVMVRGHSHDVALASRDLRGLELAGTLLEGETCIYAPGETGDGQARALFKADGSIHLYTRKGNTSAGQGITVQLDAENGAIRMLNDLGHAVLLTSDGITLTTGAAALKLEAGGNITLVGTGQTQIDGAGILLGSVAVPVANAALKGPTGVSGSASLKVLIE